MAQGTHLVDLSRAAVWFLQAFALLDTFKNFTSCQIAVREGPESPNFPTRNTCEK